MDVLVSKENCKIGLKVKISEHSQYWYQAPDLIGEIVDADTGFYENFYVRVLFENGYKDSYPIGPIENSLKLAVINKKYELWI